MPIKVDILKTIERNDRAIIDVEFFKKAEPEEKYTEVGAELFHKVQALTMAMARDFSEHQTMILGPYYETTTCLTHHIVHCTIICPKQLKDELIAKTKEAGENRDFEFKEVENLSIPG
ncbi:MAG: hypothetical protein COU82_02110 [Candidatus Portnoybacteria bacterium CG10_big_fil_rev_8_21_14_0_10_38_18]|uniref:Uncharacterized protein n=1 Tax=Candidatus Portnoybacteria bacterium CG10_big_fil_rev_8_21_14_0_10_38_18 TaxID=1974813 RepID=A0A2M8KBX1_9BACT|nr:MAG: hypothetical protein COU82_02110 [Candidatus Portnoybacteria bacterium CG10_big_fil_rev_8_21_14_0_10_38_18]